MIQAAAVFIVRGIRLVVATALVVALIAYINHGRRD